MTDNEERIKSYLANQSVWNAGQSARDVPDDIAWEADQLIFDIISSEEVK